MMENKKLLNNEELDAVTGGESHFISDTYESTGYINYRAHWQAEGYPMGQTFRYDGHTWYRFANGDTLGKVSSRFGVSISTLQQRNPNTLQNPNLIYAGEAIVLY